MAIHVTIAGGKTIKLNVRPVHTVSNVLEFLSASTNLSADVHLMLDGKALDPATTVAELKLEETSTLQVSSPSRSGTPTQSSATAVVAEKPSISSTSTQTPSGSATPTKRKSNKPRCSKDGCKAPAQPIVGDCGFCQKRFCGKHRMLESHNCEGLEDARQADKDRNAAKLEGERTVMLRGL
jgi:predicted nucleic acid binding AN1-type Zn finger protein